uniref:ATP synthase F0 subunit 8 n=1 Tax=Microplitis manilae TaxID=1427173 RepID=UPI0025520105|nr:ATP synthase F0 subunit 8 [Microplitis manilae]WGS91495.1 ATP synthase F0 subunit 8 [Microplitis manilae]WUY11102.1 ATP synthase F0 subunit 8 [Microplitis manilae]
MPQMSPMDWLFLMMYFLMIYMFFLTNMYFILKIYLKYNKLFLNLKLFNMKWY